MAYIVGVAVKSPVLLELTGLFYTKAHLQNLRADFRDMDRHLASRQEMIRLHAKPPDPGLILGEQGDDEIAFQRIVGGTYVTAGNTDSVLAFRHRVCF